MFTSFSTKEAEHYIQVLRQTLYEHKSKLVKKYGTLTNLGIVRFKQTVAREKQIKSGSRKDKLKLIEDFNSEWKDLYECVL